MSTTTFVEDYVSWTNNWTITNFSDTEIKNTDELVESALQYRVKTDPVPSDFSHATNYSHGRINRILLPYEVNNSAQTVGTDTDYLSGYSVGTLESVLVFPIATTPFVNYIDQNAFHRVQVECLAKLGTGKMELGVTLAEMRKSVATVADLAADLANVVHAVRHKDTRLLRKLFGLNAVDTVAGRWLQFSLGIRPMVSDLKAAADLFDKGIEDRSTEDSPPYYIKATRNISSQFDIGDEVLGTRNIGSEKYHCTIHAEIANPETHGLVKLGLTPLPVAWELVPLSWVADYAVPIGTMLKALDAPVGLTFNDGWTSIRGSERIINSVQLVKNGTNVGDPIKRLSSATSFRRYAMTDYPAIVPYYKNPLSETHYANVAALIARAASGNLDLNYRYR